MEPYKTHEGEFERGVPKSHDKQGKLFLFFLKLIFDILIDCSDELMQDDPQCKHETFADSQMLGAGHHVRAETNTPIIGILMQPIPEESDGNQSKWNEEYERLQQLRFKEILRS